MCVVCLYGPAGDLWCTECHSAAQSPRGRSQTSVTSGLWFSPSQQSSLWPGREDAGESVSKAPGRAGSWDSPSGGGSTDCGSNPGFLPALRSAGPCPHTRGGPTTSSASRSVKTDPSRQPMHHSVLVPHLADRGDLRGIRGLKGSESCYSICVFTYDEISSRSQKDCSWLLPEMMKRSG